MIKKLHQDFVFLFYVTSVLSFGHQDSWMKLSLKLSMKTVQVHLIIGMT